jgi:arginyl-tRNA synthetase
VIDYSSPNVAKPLHVGHLRSTIIGDAITRILRFLGHKVVTDNHLGDWGTQFGMLIYGYKNLLNKEAYKKDPVRELARLYVEVRRLDENFEHVVKGVKTWLQQCAPLEEKPWREVIVDRSNPSLIETIADSWARGLRRKSGSDEDEDAGEGGTENYVRYRYRTETYLLHAGEQDALKLWREFMPPCLEEIHKVYKKLEILSFDHEHGESFYQPILADVVASVQAAGVAEVGEGGALIIRFGPENVALVRKRDGAFTYMTTDLATVKYRAEEFEPDVVLYVVDFRQSQHFANVFEAARRWGYTAMDLVHVKFGSVLGKDGKPIKTREGGATELTQLIDRAIELGAHLFELTYWKRKGMGHEVPDYPDDATLHEIAEAVGVGAVKYADLSQNRTTDYTFDFDKMLATNGNTATYMQYAYARCRAIFRKGEVEEARFRACPPPPVVISNPAERALALQLLCFSEAVENAAADYLPHFVTGYLWDLCKSYSIFFESCPVLKAEPPELKDSRLLLVDLVGRVIKQALDLLGIRVVERM